MADDRPNGETNNAGDPDDANDADDASEGDDHDRSAAVDSIDPAMAPNRATLWGRVICAELAASGVSGVCFAPGSRSTPQIGRAHV